MASSINASTSGAGGVITTADSSGVLNIQTAGTTAITVDASQKVGIGTTSPSSQLAVQTTAGSSTGFLKFTDVTYGGDVRFGKNTGISNDAILGTWAANNTLIYTNGSEAMRINTGGNVLVGTSSATRANRERLEVYTTGGEGILSRVSDLSYAAFITKSLDAGAGTHFIGYWEKSDGTNVGKITHDNSTTSYTTTSDYRLKENVQPMTGALDKVAMLKPVTFKWIDSQKNGQGFIAHELQEVVPDCVVGEKDAMREDGKIEPQSIDTSFLVATLTAAIQELTERVKALEAK